MAFVSALGEVADPADRPFLQQRLAALRAAKPSSPVSTKDAAELEADLVRVLKTRYGDDPMQ